MLEQVIAGLKAAGEPTRLRLLHLLNGHELTVTELTQILGQSQPRVSRHLKLLMEAGLVERLPEGAWAFYRLAEGKNGQSNGTASAEALAQLVVGLGTEADPIILGDQERLDAVKQARSEHAASYFRDNAESWNQIRALHISEEEVERAIIESVISGPPITELMDLGTGTGRILEILSPHVTRGIGVDASHDMLTIARANLEAAQIDNCHVRQADIFALPFEEASVDFVTIHQVLHYFADPRRAVKQAARLLKPGGRMMIIDFAPHELEFLRTDHAHRRLGFASDEVRNWCRDAGLTLKDDIALPPGKKSADTHLTVNVWLAERHQKEK